MDQRMKTGDLKWFSMKAGGSNDVIYPILPDSSGVPKYVLQPSNFPGFLSGVDAAVDLVKLVKTCQTGKSDEIVKVGKGFAELLNVYADWQSSVPPFSGMERGLQSVLDNIDLDMEEPLKVSGHTLVFSSDRGGNNNSTDCSMASSPFPPNL